MPILPFNSISCIITLQHLNLIIILIYGNVLMFYSDRSLYAKKNQQFRLILAVLLLTFGITTQAEIKTIKDVLGREVNVDVPVKNAVLGFLLS